MDRKGEDERERVCDYAIIANNYDFNGLGGDCATAEMSYVNIVKELETDKSTFKFVSGFFFLDMILKIQDLHIPNFNFLIIYMCNMLNYLVFCILCY